MLRRGPQLPGLRVGGSKPICLPTSNLQLPVVAHPVHAWWAFYSPKDQIMDMQDPTAQAPAAPAAQEPAPQGYCIQICVMADGSFKVSKGDLPMDTDMSAGQPDTGMAPDGDQDADDGQTADNIGDALKLALDVYDKAGSQEGEDQFAAGFGGAQKPAAPGGM